MRAVVIGSGMSGLTCGAYLARNGHQVLVLERFENPGGVTATFCQDGYGWDLGPLLLEGFGPGDRATAVLRELGVHGRVETVQEDRGLTLPQFSLWKPEKYGGPYWRRERLSQVFPDERANLDRYYCFYDRMIHLASLARCSETEKGVRLLALKLRMWFNFQAVKNKSTWTANQLMDSYFHHDDLKMVFVGIVADFVTKPSEFPALGVPFIHLETAFDKRIPTYPGSRIAQTGYHYIRGGCQSLVKAVMGVLAEYGGEVACRKSVAKILVERGAVQGVVLADGSQVRADIVIASGGAKETFYDLVDQEYFPSDWLEPLEQCRFMESVLMVHLGIDLDPRPYQPAALCYYYQTSDLEESVERFRQGMYHEGKEGFLIYVPSLHSPELAPPDHYAMTIYTIAPNFIQDGDWTSRKEELSEKLVIEAERIIPGLRKHIITRVILTPEDFRVRVNQQSHSFGGIPPVVGNRPPKHRTPIRGLWFIGSQSESGGGVMNVMLGAQKTAKMIQEESSTR